MNDAQWEEARTVMHKAELLLADIQALEEAGPVKSSDKVSWADWSTGNQKIAESLLGTVIQKGRDALIKELRDEFAGLRLPDEAHA